MPTGEELQTFRGIGGAYPPPSGPSRPLLISQPSHLIMEPVVRQTGLHLAQNILRNNIIRRHRWLINAQTIHKQRVTYQQSVTKENIFMHQIHRLIIASTEFSQLQD
jgi:hypothetical protein